MGWKVRKPEIVADLAGAMVHCRTEAARRLVAGYAELFAAGGTIPAKNGLDLRRFAAAMPSLVLCAIRKPDQCIYRLAGENTCRRIGLNPVGRNYYDFVPPERRAHAMHAMNTVVGVPCGFRADIE